MYIEHTPLGNERQRPLPSTVRRARADSLVCPAQNYAPEVRLVDVFLVVGFARGQRSMSTSVH
jgi:hypothetical protein